MNDINPKYDPAYEDMSQPPDEPACGKHGVNFMFDGVDFEGEPVVECVACMKLQLGEVRGLLKEMHDAYTFTDVRFTGTAMESAFIKVHKHLEDQPTKKPKSEAECICKDVGWHQRQWNPDCQLHSREKRKCPSTYSHGTHGKLTCEKDADHLNRVGDVEHYSHNVKWMSV